ncbi:MAG: SHOCT domain-containing protein [Solirubrobacteraceae bacterium]
MSTGDWVFSILGTLIVIALIVGVIVWFVSELGAHSGGRAREQGVSAREILDRRLASGELTIEQYEQLSDSLGEGVSPGPDPRQPRRPAGALG